MKTSTCPVVIGFSKRAICTALTRTVGQDVIAARHDTRSVYNHSARYSPRRTNASCDQWRAQGKRICVTSPHWLFPLICYKSTKRKHKIFIILCTYGHYAAHFGQTLSIFFFKKIITLRSKNTYVNKQYEYYNISNKMRFSLYVLILYQVHLTIISSFSKLFSFFFSQKLGHWKFNLPYLPYQVSTAISTIFRSIFLINNFF